MLKLCIGCFGIGVNVLVNIVVQMVQGVVVGYLKKKRNFCKQNMFMYVCFIFGKKRTRHDTQFPLDRNYSYQQLP